MRASALASTVLPTPGHVLDEHVALGEQAEQRQSQRLGGRVHDGREAGDDAVREIGCLPPARTPLARGESLHQRPSSSRSTSSSTAPAIAGFGARGTSRSPPAVMSVTSLSGLSKPMSVRPTSL